MRKSFEQILQEHRGSVTATTPTATTGTPRKSFEQILQERRTATVTTAPSAAAASGMRKSFNQILQEHRASVTPAIPKGYYPQQHPVQKKPELPKGYYPQQHSSQKMAQMQRDLSKERYEGYRKNQSRIDEIDSLLSGMTTGEEEQSQLKAERKRLEAANRTYERSYLHRDKTFVENAEAADFAQLSEKRDFGNPTKEQFDEFDAKAYGGYLSHYDGSPSQKVQGAFPETVPVEQAMAQMGVDLTIHDPLGLYLDTLHSSADEGENDYYSPVNSVAGKEYNRILAQGDEEQWGNLTDEEIRMYYYLMNTKGKDAAISFLDGMARELQYRETEEYKEYIKNAPAGEKIFHNAISTVVKPVGEVAAFADEAISHIKGEDPNFNNRAHELKNYAESTRGVTADSINRATGAAESDFITWGDVYQGVMSGVDSALAGYMLGPTGASVVLGMGAASSRQRELYEQGASQEEILAGGLLAGGVEALFEHVSLGYFFDKVMNQPAKTAAGQIGQILLQGGVEASEEYCTTLANYLADFAVRYQTSDGAKMMQAYIEDGYSEKDAFLAVLGDINEKGFHDAVVGMISGVSMSGGPKVSQTVSINNLGNGYIHGTNGFTMQDAIEIGLNNAKGTDAYLAAQAIQKRMENGKRISPYAVGRMVMESQTEAAHRAKTIEQGVLESAARVDPTNQVRLDTKTAEAIAAAAVKLNQRVEFAALDADLVSKGLPGSYNPVTDTVMLNPRYSVKDILGYTLAHEMTHSTEGTRQLAALEQTVQRLVGAQTWQQTVSKTRRQYAEIGVGLTDAQARQEALAHWVGENLFKDGFAKAIVDGDVTTGNVFVRTIDRVRRALTGQKDNPSAADIAGLERLFMQAIENKQGAREGDAEYAVSNARVIDLSNDSELAKRVGNLTGTPKYRIIQQYIFENLGGDSVVLSDGKKAIVDQRDAQHIGKKAGSKKIAIISEIKKVVESAELVAEENSTKDKKFDYFWYYEAVLRYGKETFPIYVNVGRSRYDGTYHLYDLTQKLRDTAHRTNGVGRPVGYALENGISNNRVTQPDPIVNTHSMHELAEYAPKTFLPSERVSGDALVGADATLQNRSTTDETIPPSVDADTSLYTREAFGNDTAGNRNDAQVVERKAATIPEAENIGKTIKTVKERLGAKLQNFQAELASNRQQRAESLAGYNQEISRLLAEYDGKKDKNTKAANDILRRIDRLQRMKGNVDADYSKRISDLEERAKKVAEEVRTGESPTEQAAMRQEVHAAIVDNIKTTYDENGYSFDDVLKKAKDLSTFATVDNTPQRVMEKALGYKEGQILADLTVNKVAQNETEGIKWLNAFTDRKSGLLAQLSKQYNIKPGSKESAAAQMYAEGFYVNKGNEIIQYGDAELAKDFPDATVRANIKGLAKDPRIRQIYDETLAAINESRTRNAYPEIKQLDNYFLHFRAMDDTFSRLGIPFSPKDIKAKDLPTDLNGVTADLKPGQPYFASAKHRQGKRTSFDLLGGLEQYLTSAKNQIYHIDDIQTLRALRNYIADLYGQANGLANLDELTEEEAQAKIKEVYGGHLSTFAKFLNEEANVIAGKTSLIDRGLEGIIGRRGISVLDTINRQVGANMVGFNLSSSMTNFLAAVQGMAKTNKFDFVKAMAQTTASKLGAIVGKTDDFAEQSPVVIRRKGADRYHRTAWQKVADAGYVLMSAVDNISTEVVARAKYNELTRKGMDAQQAHVETDKWVSRLMGDRSLGQQPQLYNSKMLGILTKFQLEVRNQLDSQFYDTIQEAKVSTENIENDLARNAAKAAKIASTFFQLAVLQHLFGKAFESVAGYNPAFDIVEALIKVFGWDDDENDEDTVLDNVEEGFLTLLGDLPYTSTLTGGRIPIASALPIEQLVTGKDDYGNEKSRLETLKETAPYYVLPAGYGQIKKTAQGLGMFDDDRPIAGSYTDSGNLRFSVEDTVGNRVQAALFGQYANENARAYFDGEIEPAWHLGTAADDPISQELLRLYDTAEEGKSKAIPTAITRDEAQDKGLDYVEDNRALGMVNRQAVEDFIHDRWPYQVQETLPNGKTRTVTKYYSEMTDDERRRVLSRIYGKAKEMVLGEDEEKKTKSKDDRYFESIYEELK